MALSRRPLTAGLLAAAGAVAARQALRVVNSAVAPQALERTNFRGRTVSLAGGPALAFGASLAAAAGARGGTASAAALVAGLGCGAVGAYDDVVGSRPGQKAAKGFRGHLAALSEGRVTTGLVKIVGVGAIGLAASALLAADARTGRSRRRAGGVNLALGAGVIAGTANLINLLDLRPGRAIKAGLLIGAPLSGAVSRGAREPGAVSPSAGIAAGTVGAAVGLLPEDLDEKIMLGDAGANALGALLGTALAARTGPIGRAVLLAAIAGLTAASERVSFTQVIARTPVLRELDALGQRGD